VTLIDAGPLVALIDADEADLMSSTVQAGPLVAASLVLAQLPHPRQQRGQRHPVDREARQVAQRGRRHRSNNSTATRDTTQTPR